MMNEKIKEIVEKLFWEILEQHFFLLPDPFEGELPEKLPEDYWVASMNVSGDIKGDFRMYIPRSVCAEVDATLMADTYPSGKNDANEMDFAKEAINIIVPSIMIDWAMGKYNFKASLPECSAVSVGHWKEMLSMHSGSWSYFAVNANGIPVIFSYEFCGGK